MSQFEEKLNAILGDQQAMGQIMALARSLSNGEEESSSDFGGPPVQEPQGFSTAECGPAIPDLSALLGDIDPNLLQVGMRILQDMRGGEDRNAALLQALRPFLREERQAKLDRALQVAKLTRLARTALDAMGGKGEQERIYPLHSG